MASNPSQSPLPVGSIRRGRRSWFDAPPLTTLNCPGNDESKQSCARPARKKRSLESVENLTLTHFTTPPRIDFGSVVLGKTKVRTLLIRNPHDYEQDVIVERFPYKKKFLIEEERSVAHYQCLIYVLQGIANECCMYSEIIPVSAEKVD